MKPATDTAKTSAPQWLLPGGMLLLSLLLVWCAQRSLRETDTISPDHVGMHYYLGKYQRLTGRTEQAVENLRRALANDWGSFQTHTELGNALIRLGRSEEAVASFQNALQLEPNHAEAHCGLGSIHYFKGELAEAVKHYSKALEKEPREVSALNNLAWIQSTSEDEAVRNGQEAVVLAERAVEVTEGKNPHIIMTLAAAYAEAGRFAEAVAAAERCIALARESGNENLAAAIGEQRDLYQKGQPLRAATP